MALLLRRILTSKSSISPRRHSPLCLLGEIPAFIAKMPLATNANVDFGL